MEVINYIQETRQWMIDGTDPRVKGWFMMEDPAIPIGIIFCYYLMVYFLPKFMENREPFKLKGVLIVYNFALVFLCAWVIYENLAVVYLAKYSMICQPVDYSNNPLAVRIMNQVWWFYVSKIIELADTLFFILRKKNDQVTFLHIFHHSTMPFVIWGGSNYIAGGQVWMVMVANSTVHVVMYTYYALSAIGPHMRKYLWWKKHLTKLQLTHFFVVQGHSLVNMIFAKDCDYPSLPNWTIVIYTNLQAILFANFYYNAYVKKRRDISSGKSTNANGDAAKALEDTKMMATSNGYSNGVHHAANGEVIRKRAAATNGHVSKH